MNNDLLLSRNAIVDIFNDLGASSASINISGNYGTLELTEEDVSIASNKGWSVIY
jgi:hypothetical protein